LSHLDSGLTSKNYYLLLKAFAPLKNNLTRHKAFVCPKKITKLKVILMSHIFYPETI